MSCVCVCLYMYRYLCEDNFEPTTYRVRTFWPALSDPCLMACFRVETLGLRLEGIG